jgi:16S rRNA (uracil1498-N3)-methyltransferase
MNHTNLTRTFLNHPYTQGEIISLNKKDFHHEINVLRKKAGDRFIVFDGSGNSALAGVKEVDKKSFNIELIEIFQPSPREGIDIDLGQSLIKNDPFNFAIQKSTELGVRSFSPLISRRVVVKRRDPYSVSRMAKWLQTAVGACEQCGENWIPKINEPVSIKDWAINSDAETKIVLYPEAKDKLSNIAIKNSVSIAIGPEGDFTEDEIATLSECGFIPVTMGKRILRAETAAISVVSALRYGAKEF